MKNTGAEATGDRRQKVFWGKMIWGLLPAARRNEDKGRNFHKRKNNFIVCF